MDFEEMIRINIDSTLEFMIESLCKRCGITNTCLINIAVKKIANGDSDAFVIEPFIADIRPNKTWTLPVYRLAYTKCCAVCEEHGVSEQILITAYIVRCVMAQRIFL